MFQLKSDKLVAFSAQKFGNCLAAVNEAVPKALKNFTACRFGIADINLEIHVTLYPWVDFLYFFSLVSFLRCC